MQRQTLNWRIARRDYPDDILQMAGLVDYDMNVLFRGGVGAVLKRNV